MKAGTNTTLETLVETGFLEEGERLYASIGARYGRPAMEFEGELTSDGQVRIVSDGGDGSLNGIVASASSAITQLYRRPDGGWKNWKVERDGQQVALEVIRAEFDRRYEGPSLESLDVTAPEIDSSEITPASAEISQGFNS
jgi:hypothetical protein